MAAHCIGVQATILTVKIMSTKVGNNCPSRSGSPISTTKTSDRYNRGQLYKSPISEAKSYLFTVDWYESYCFRDTGKGILADFDEDDVLESYETFHTTIIKDSKTGNGTKNYKYGFEVLFNNQSVGLLLLCPRQAYKEKYSCSFRFHNHILYQTGWELIYDVLLDDLGLRHHSLTRVDIACDGSGFMNKYSLLNNGTYQNVGRATHRNYQTSKNVITGFDIGSRASAKSITGYWKGRKLKTENKTYISDYWKKNNLITPVDNVERLELRLKGKAFKSIKNFDYRRLADEAYLIGIMKCQLENFFCLVKNSALKKDKNITRAKKIHVIPWAKLESSDVHKIKKVKKPSTKWAAQRALTFDLQRYFAGWSSDSNLFENKELSRMQAIADEYCIRAWFDNLYKRIEKRDKAVIAQMKYNRMEMQAGGTSIFLEH